MTLLCPMTTCQCPLDVFARLCPVCGTDVRAYVLASTRADMFFNRAIEAADARKYDKARQAIQTCLNLVRTDDEARMVLGKIQWKSRQTAQARQIWEALAREARDPLLKYAAGRCLEAAKENPAPAHGKTRKKTKSKKRKR